MTRSLDLRLVPGALLALCSAFWLVLIGPGVAICVCVVTSVLTLGMIRPLRRGWIWAGQVVLGLTILGLMSGAAAAHKVVASSVLVQDAAQEGALLSIRATVTAEPKPLAGSSTRFRVLLRTNTALRVGSGEAQRVHVPLIVFGDATWAEIPYGTQVEVRGRVKPVTDAGQKERFRLTPVHPPTRMSDPGGLLAWTADARSGLLAHSVTLPEHARGLVPGIGVGDRSQMSPRLGEAMRITGLTHVTAVSGSHFAIVAATVLGIGTLLRLPPRLRVLVAGCAMAVFVLLVRPEPSVARAGVMGAFALAGMSLGRPARALTGLAACVIGLLLADPWLARNYGFILSVTATGALVLGASPLTRVLMRWTPQWLALMIAVPTVAQAACAPVIILFEPRLSTYAVPANLLAIPALGPATICAVLAAVLSSFWPGAAAVLATVASWATGWIGGIAMFFAGLPGSYPPWPSGIRGAVILALCTAGLVLVGVSLRFWLNGNFLPALAPGVRDRTQGPNPRRKHGILDP